MTTISNNSWKISFSLFFLFAHLFLFSFSF